MLGTKKINSYKGSKNTLNSILVFIPNGIGDVLMSVPLFKRLVNTYGVKNVVGVVANPVQRKILLSVLGNEFQCWCRFDAKPWGQLRLFWRIIKRRFDICYAPMISKNIINKLFFFATFTKVVFPSTSIKKSVGWIRNGKISLADFPGHQVNYLLNFVGINGALIDISDVSPDELKISTLKPLSISSEGLILAVGLSCGEAERHKIPGPSFFAQTVNALAKKYALKIFLFGNNSDETIIKEFQVLLNDGIEVIKFIDKPIVDVISMLSQCDAGVVGTTGQGHMMAAAGLPLLITAGVTNPYESGPYVSRASILKHDFDCGPCYQEDYRFGCGRIKCMDTLSPNLAVVEIDRLVTDKRYGLSWFDGAKKVRPLPKTKIEKIVALNLSKNVY